MLTGVSILYLLTGALTGLTAGLLGVGGGLIVVPALVAIFSQRGVAPDHLMHLALGTSLATIVATSIASILAHQRHHAILWRDVSRFAPGLTLGALTGSLLAHRLPTTVLQTGFALFLMSIAASMLTGKQMSGRSQGEAGLLAGGIIGLISALTGIGGGSMTVPYLSWKGRDLRHAIATSAACGLPIALAATIGFIVTGATETQSWSGYVDLSAVSGVVLTSILTAPLGAKLAHALPVPQIRKVFALFLLAVGLRMLMTT